MAGVADVAAAANVGMRADMQFGRLDANVAQFCRAFQRQLRVARQRRQTGGEFAVLLAQPAFPVTVAQMGQHGESCQAW